MRVLSKKDFEHSDVTPSEATRAMAKNAAPGLAGKKGDEFVAALAVVLATFGCSLEETSDRDHFDGARRRRRERWEADFRGLVAALYQRTGALSRREVEEAENGANLMADAHARRDTKGRDPLGGGR